MFFISFGQMREQTFLFDKTQRPGTVQSPDEGLTVITVTQNELETVCTL